MPFEEFISKHYICICTKLRGGLGLALFHFRRAIFRTWSQSTVISATQRTKIKPHPRDDFLVKVD